ncbi:MAG: Ig-like domain-containing protein, partial [Candidatus Falkowbacteria bacterium]|nr:Ig-like domain-containing protein [Candidatus Falkowbacteria bacterium]
MLAKKSNNRSQKITAKLLLIFAVGLLLLIPVIYVLAASTDLGLNEAANIGLPDTGGRDIKQLLVDIVRYFLSFLGLVAVIVIIYGGWLWMTSGGNQFRLSNAKKVLTNAIIGLIIIIFAFVIVSWVANWIIGTISPPTGPGGGRGPGSGIGLAASGNSAIESHYPTRDQRNVPRNTRIAITFREPITTADIITANYLNTYNVKIFKSNEDNTRLHTPNLRATTTDNRTFRFLQEEPYMGSPSEKVWYTVELGNGIRKENGDSLFSFGSGYAWQFELSTVLDNEPPRITSVIPRFGASEPRNVVVQINFNESIDPISASGLAPAFDYISVSTGAPLAGHFYISNLYRTVEFLTLDQCGINSCGMPVYCLPANSDIRVRVLAATLANPGSGSARSDLGNGIMDMAGNSLDGNSDGIAVGPTSQNSLPAFDPAPPPMTASSDDYTWAFRTTNTIDVSAPTINAVNPGFTAADVSYSEIISAEFSKLLMVSSLNKDNVSLAANPAENIVFYWLTATNVPEAAPANTIAYMNHRNFVSDSDTTYAPVFSSGVLDIYQNCFSPAAGMSCTPSAATPYC